MVTGELLYRRKRFDVVAYSCIVPLLAWLTAYLWKDLWPYESQVLSQVADLIACGPWSPKSDLFVPSEDQTTSPHIVSFFTVAEEVRGTGIPQLYPDSNIELLPTELSAPLLGSSNSFLIVGALWVLWVCGLVIVLLLPIWTKKYLKAVSYAPFTSADQKRGEKKPSHVFLSKWNKTANRTDYFIEPIQNGHSPSFVVDDNGVKTGEVDAVPTSTMTINNKKYSLSLPYTGESGCKGLSVDLLPIQSSKNTLYDTVEAAVNSFPLRHSDVKVHRSVFGMNIINIPIPTYAELALEHATQPLFVFQLFSTILWLLDEYWKYSMVTFFMLVSFEAQSIAKRRKDLSAIQDMRRPALTVGVWRSDDTTNEGEDDKGSLYKLCSTELQPGDHFCLSPPDSAPTYPYAQLPLPEPVKGQVGIPVDGVVLTGSLIVDEAMMTGESLPQMKTGLVESGAAGSLVDANRLKGSMLHSGTVALNIDSDPSNESDGRNDAPGVTSQASESTTNPPRILCLRTAAATSQGKLIRIVMNNNSTSSSKEAIVFLLILTGIALIASSYVLWSGWSSPNRNHYKLLLHCVMILTSVVSPELPIMMSLTINMSMNKLFKQKLFCTQPLRLPDAGRITYCCFDKTGTLTEAEVQLEAVNLDSDTCISVHSPKPVNTRMSTSESSPSIVQDKNPETAVADKMKLHVDANSQSGKVMGLCNSLLSVHRVCKLPVAQRKPFMERKLIGDPLEQVTSEASGWVPVKGDCMAYFRVADEEAQLEKKLLDIPVAKIMKRFAFSSAEQRMTVVANVDNNVEVLMKGAPDRVFSILGLPESHWARKDVFNYALEGKRVLAMAYKKDSSLLKCNSSTLPSRDVLESGMTFCGLLVFSCPVKPQTVQTLDALRDSGHSLVMITGDDPRTAAFVAKQTGIVKDKVVWNIIGTVDESKETIVADSLSTMVSSSEETTPFLIGAQKLRELTTKFVIQTVDATETRTVSVHDLREMKPTSSFVVTGAVLEPILPLKTKLDVEFTQKEFAQLLRTNPESLPLAARFVPLISVFARVSPQHKESIISILNQIGEMTLMCGDGCNDVGALKAAHIGISLLNNEIEAVEEETKKGTQRVETGELEDPEAARIRRHKLGLTALQIGQLEKMDSQCRQMRSQFGPPGVPLTGFRLAVFKVQLRAVQSREAQMLNANIALKSGDNKIMKNPKNSAKLQELMDEMGDELNLKPGDASMASPFTYKGKSIRCVTLVMKHGKTTLAKIMMQYKLLALQSIGTAFALSVLTLNGVKYGDIQMTASGVLMSIIGISASNARGSNKLTKMRVVDSMADPHFYWSIIAQSAVHIATVIIGWKVAAAYSPEYLRRDTGVFKPSLVNTVVFLLSATESASLYIANYEGAPFLRGWKEFPILKWTLVAYILATFTVSMELIPELNQALQLVPHPSEGYKVIVNVLLVFDLVAASVVGLLLQQYGRYKETMRLKALE